MKRPPFSQHPLRLDNAVMPEIAAFFYPSFTWLAKTW